MTTKTTGTSDDSSETTDDCKWQEIEGSHGDVHRLRVPGAWIYRCSVVTSVFDDREPTADEGKTSRETMLTEQFIFAPDRS